MTQHSAQSTPAQHRRTEEGALVTPVILSGGSGSRLWPLSRQAFAKQFLALGADGRSLLQNTVLRVADPALYSAPVVVTAQAHRFHIADQLDAIDVQPGHVVLEPAGRNTAPAIALAALALAQARQGDALMLVLPSDHAVADPAAFNATIAAAAPLAQAGRLVTFGITPTAPETGYGYIEAADALAPAGFAVASFVEKPDAARAETFLQNGNYYWNGGIFLMSATAYLEALIAHAPDIYHACKAAMAEATADDNAVITPNAEAFAACPDDSIDYAVMEKADQVAVVPYQGHWNDIGSFSALHSELPHDDDGNATHGDVWLQDTNNCLVWADDAMVTTAGVDNLVIVETKDAVLVASREKAQDVKKIVTSLKQAGREEATFHRRVYKPWGSFEGMDKGARFQVKRLTVKPGQKLSLQSHKRRSEHWIVVHGKVRVTRGWDTFDLGEDQSAYIPLGEVHRLENPFDEVAHLIEVQTGDYLGEDDIVRYEDTYGRTSADAPAEIPANMHAMHIKRRPSIMRRFIEPVKQAIRQLPGSRSLVHINRWVRYWALYLRWLATGRQGEAPQVYKIGTIKTYARRYGVRNFVETGTLYGETTNAVRGTFDRLVTIELNDELYRKATARFRNRPQIEVVRGDSGEKIPEVLQSLTAPALFWLDGHYSGGITAKGKKETPIEEELGAIFDHPVKGHVILVDDARCFTGTHDYPTRDALYKMVAERTNGGYSVTIEDDIIRIVPTAAANKAEKAA